MDARRDLSRQARGRRTGFTLIELLVVMAVIMILASITIPSVMRAGRISRERSCASNVKSIGQALFTYAINWDRYFPANRPQPRDPTKTYLPAQLRGYDDLSVLWGTFWDYKRNPGGSYKTDAEGNRIPIFTTRFVADLHVFNCPSTRDNATTYEELRFKRTGKAIEYTYEDTDGDGEPDSESGSQQVTPTPRPQLSYEYCGEFNPSLQYPDTNTSLGWLVHDEDANNENKEEVLKDGELDWLKLTGKANHQTRGGNVCFMDGRVEWITTLSWPNAVMKGMREWSRVTGWRLPSERYDIP
jgi:prepilin-type N-terminal cleavage/methylation domain-containing protein/prepilin-type processing-associated H-X9-DG protein